MNILLTGANGFLGYYLTQQLLQQNHIVIATGKGENRLPFTSPAFIYEPMDFTDPYAVHDVFEKHQPDVVIHSGAISKPDDCEKDQWQAYVTNVEGTVTLLTNAESYKSLFIFLSTDFIFSGEKGMYVEDDEAGPVNYYGQTKLEAEAAVKDYPFDWSIVRTVLVYGQPHGGKGNILTVVKDKLEKGEEYSVFNDQVRTPTYVEDLASGIVAIVDKKATGVYHLSGEDVLTPYEMACRLADHLGMNRSLIKKVTAEEFVQPAKRPAKTGFDISKAKRDLGFNPVSFEEGLGKTFLK
ncbi:MAG TPA: SDR family oxidoreductase [Chitinophagaceae bacterium]|jgi:dTDP-4-dehydrorhamnose reductase|nr:SDR family oxidoreductase [Chitinophagaceae bacterium]